MTDKIDVSAILSFPDPSPEQMKEGATKKWLEVAPFAINNWPESVLERSARTIFVEIEDIEKCMSIYDGDMAVIQEYADLLDEHMNWSNYFVRLNTRSPKDATYPGLPITCSGRQAMAWIASSMRCMDDLSMMFWARQKAFICLRSPLPIWDAHEYRFFAKGGEVIACSRYDYMDAPKFSIDPQVLNMEGKQFYSAYLKEHYTDVVFDMAFFPEGDKWFMLEINPYGLSDPCLFRTYEAVEMGGTRQRAKESYNEW